MLSTVGLSTYTHVCTCTHHTSAQQHIHRDTQTKEHVAHKVHEKVLGITNHLER